MARFDVYPNPSSSAVTTPYLLDVQSDLFDGFDTRMVIPLRVHSAFAKVKLPERLMPMFTVKGKNWFWKLPKWQLYLLDTETTCRHFARSTDYRGHSFRFFVQWLLSLISSTLTHIHPLPLRHLLK